MIMINTSYRETRHVCDSQTNQRFEIPPPIVVYADFESAIDDNYKHKPIMLSCLAVSRIPAIQTHLRSSMNHTRKNEIRSFIEYQLQLQVSVKKYLFDELPFRKYFQGR